MYPKDIPFGRCRRLFPWIMALALLAFVWSAQAQTYTINWYKVGGGGAMNTTNGIYTLSGTIAQHDAVAPITGGQYQLTGGFWSLISVLQTPGAPTLHIRISGTTVVVYWLDVLGWSLQQNTSLTNTPGWTASSGVTTTGDTNYLNILSPSGHLYFRLASP